MLQIGFREHEARDALYEYSDVFQSAFENVMMALEFNEFEYSDEDVDLDTSEVDFEIDDDDPYLEHVPSFE